MHFEDEIIGIKFQLRPDKQSTNPIGFGKYKQITIFDEFNVFQSFCYHGKAATM